MCVCVSLCVSLRVCVGKFFYQFKYANSIFSSDKTYMPSETDKHKEQDGNFHRMIYGKQILSFGSKVFMISTT